jgi:hypothetical protein
MNIYCHQRQELLDSNIFIEAKNGNDVLRQDQLKVWLEVEDYNQQTGEVTNRAGTWRKEDLEFFKRGTK